MIVKHRIAVLLADITRASHVVGLIEKLGAHAILATGSDDLYQALNQHPVDLIAIDHKLSGFLNGLEILERLFSDLLRPATVLIGELTPEEHQRAEMIGVQAVLPPNSTPEQICHRIRLQLSDAPQNEEVIPEVARRIVQRADYIQPLPQLLVKLIGYLNNDDINSSQLIRDISVDPLVTADLLKYANSSAVGRRQKTAKLSDAVNYLGPRKSIGVAISSGLLRARGNLMGELSPQMRHWHSCRAVLTASTAGAFAERLEKISEESAYLLGLIQDVGILVMARAFGERYVDNLRRVQRIAALRLPFVERDSYGVTHAEVSAALLRKWEFPRSFISLVLRHHDTAMHDNAAIDQRFVRTMQLGEALSDLHDNRSPQRYLALRKLLETYGPEAEGECRHCLASAVAKTSEASMVFGVPAPEEGELQAMLRDLAQQNHLTLAAMLADEEEPCESTQETASPLDDHHAASVKVLVIDDEPAVQKLVGSFLRGTEYCIITCDSVAEGRRLASQADLILCDIHLREESGIALVHELRSQHFTGPIIAISGDNHRATVLNSLQAGVSDYLLKPFSKSQLLDKLRKHRESPLPTATV